MRAVRGERDGPHALHLGDEPLDLLLFGVYTVHLIPAVVSRGIKHALPVLIVTILVVLVERVVVPAASLGAVSGLALGAELEALTKESVKEALIAIHVCGRGLDELSVIDALTRGAHTLLTSLTAGEHEYA